MPPSEKCEMIPNSQSHNTHANVFSDSVTPNYLVKVKQSHPNFHRVNYKSTSALIIKANLDRQSKNMIIIDQICLSASLTTLQMCMKL